MLKVNNLGLRVGRREILREVSFEANRGELIGLIGPNGSGKSTLIRALANLRTADGGHVTYDGQTAASLSARDFSKRVSYLEQDGVVYWPLEVRTLVTVGRLPHRRPFQSASVDDERAVQGAMELTDTLALHARTVSQISGGERMRVLLARALCVEAPLLLADEPIAALDPRHQIRVMRLLQQYAQRGNAVVVVLHDLSMAARFCDRIILISDGRIIAQGLSNDVLVPPNIRKAYRVDIVSGEKDNIPFFLPA